LSNNEPITDYLLQFDDALKLSPRRRIRVLAEVKSHLDQRAADLESEGISRRDAQLSATDSFGAPAAMAREFRPDFTGLVWHGFRSLDIWWATHPWGGAVLVAFSSFVLVRMLVSDFQDLIQSPLPEILPQLFPFVALFLALGLRARVVIHEPQRKLSEKVTAWSVQRPRRAFWLEWSTGLGIVIGLNQIQWALRSGQARPWLSPVLMVLFIYQMHRIRKSGLMGRATTDYRKAFPMLGLGSGAMVEGRRGGRFGCKWVIGFWVLGVLVGALSPLLSGGTLNWASAARGGAIWMILPITFLAVPYIACRTGRDGLIAWDNRHPWLVALAFSLLFNTSFALFRWTTQGRWPEAFMGVTLTRFLAIFLIVGLLRCFDSQRSIKKALLEKSF